MRWIYHFEEGNKEMKALLGGKGANLAEMKGIGLPVPDGFTLTTEACKAFDAFEGQLTDDMLMAIKDAMTTLEKKTNKQFGGQEAPLLVSVRSGAAASMPGMMDTILNLGLNDVTTQALAVLTGQYAFAYDSYRRLIQMYGDVVMGVEKFHFDLVLERLLNVYGVKEVHQLNTQGFERLIEGFKHTIKVHTGKAFPESPWDQLMGAVIAVFKSWHNPRAALYRRLHGIEDLLGTAVNIQQMVFGNMGDESGTGVVFTRNPSTGEKGLYGECLINAQGEDVVAGIRTPLDIKALDQVLPHVYQELVLVCEKLEAHYGDMQDIEFTIEENKLFMLQTRTGKRTAKAALQIAVDMVAEGVIDRQTALLRIDPKSLEQVLHPQFDGLGLENHTAFAKGLPASPGAAIGEIYFHAADVKRAVAAGKKAVLVRRETSPEDIEGMVLAEGIVTAFGGMTSHAAVVARSMGKCCVAGCSEIRVDEEKRILSTDTVTLHEGDVISVDGSSGHLYVGPLAMTSHETSLVFDEIMAWTESVGGIRVRANADTVKDIQTALDFGAVGVGLCRTEHMFFSPDRLLAVREMIMAEALEDRVAALKKIKPYQQEDFYDMFKVLEGRPITVRLLDPPLHEFLPQTHDEMTQLAERLNTSVDLVLERTKGLEEVNPMLGHRGCRLGITYPEIYVMQVEAIAEAVLALSQEGVRSEVEIMVPLVGFVQELMSVRKMIDHVLTRILGQGKDQVKIGTMIEVPRAALTAYEIAEHADFFSFGTNDLTQMTLGFSRDDAGKFIGDYIHSKVLKADPFEQLDVRGVGRLMEIAVTDGKRVKPGLKTGICGEHGGEPNAIHFAVSLGLDYVSCSPFRVPVARLAACHAQLKKN